MNNPIIDVDVDLPGIPQTSEDDLLAQELDTIKDKDNPVRGRLDDLSHKETTDEQRRRLKNILDTKTNQRRDDPINILGEKNDA